MALQRLWSDQSHPPWLRLGVTAGVAALYVPAMAEMVRVWQTDTYAGHGMFVPLFSALVAWIDRERLRAAAGPGTGRRGSRTGGSSTAPAASRRKPR